MYLFIKGLEFQVPCYYNKGNQNNCLCSLEFPYGTANGYERRFMITLLHPKGFSRPNVDSYNGHSRFSFGCGLFTISFDWYSPETVVAR